MRRVPLQLELLDETVPALPSARLQVPPPAPQGPPHPPKDAGRPDPGRPDPARALVERLERLMRSRLGSLVLTDNKSRIISARPAARGERLDVRIHRCFATASDATLGSVVVFLRSRRRSAARRQALRAIRQHFAGHGPRPEASSRRRSSLRPAGRCFDLRQLRDDLNRRYFGGELEVAITWGRASQTRPAPARGPATRGPATRRGRKRRRGRCGFSIQLGSYDERRNLVRLHRSLDHAEVPRCVVESVVYHEMLHAALPPVVVNGRRRIHTPEFRRRERLYHRHGEAERWIDDNLERLAAWR